MCDFRVLWVLLLTIFLSKHPCYSFNSLDQASFYGGSYISIPLREAKSSTDIHFKFKTHLPNALIILVAGQIDHCIVGLDNGQLKISINLGAGDSELYSPSSVKLNDFKWHEVFIIRKEGDLSLIIDNIYTSKIHLSGDFFELNIHYGLYIGGQGNHTDLFYGHMENFRGCLSEVMYNGILVLEQGRRRQFQAAVSGVTWNCAAEFDAPVDKPISFIDDGSFFTISHQTSQTLKIQLDIRTILEHAILIYNSGIMSKHDLFALEIWKGKLKVTLKHNDKFVEHSNEEFISDGQWHKISLKITSNIVELNVNSISRQSRLPRGLNVDLTETFYIGGVEISKRTRAMTKGLRTSDSSFKGCLKQLSFGEKLKGLPDVHVSEGLLPGCVWQYPCLSLPPACMGNCQQYGLDSFKCECSNNDNCNQTTSGNGPASNEFKVSTQNKNDLEILALQPLEAYEGQNVLVTSNNLHIILDYPKYGIRDTGIKFTVLDPPEHGSISIDLWTNEKQYFTFLDVSKDKVHYIHDGSETVSDRIGLAVEFSSNDMFILPAYLQEKFKFTLIVNVTPLNDAPQLKLTSASVLRIAQGTKKIIGTDLLVVNDPDSNAKQLVFNVIDSGPGHFEYDHKPAAPITTFTQEEIENHHVLYAHHLNFANKSYVTLQVSDGIETSAPNKFRVSVFPIHWRLQNNTGLILMHQTSALITPYNLSFASNVVNVTESGQFFIEQGPQFGIVEVEKDVGVWENSIIFTNDEIRQHRVRYRHLTSDPDFDEFQFRTTYNKSMLYTFRMSFAKCRLHGLNERQLQLNEFVESEILKENLQFQTEPVQSLTNSIQYQIIGYPQYGFVLLTVSKYRMRLFDLFTQEDIILKNVKYKLHSKAYSIIEDVIVFKVIAPGCRNMTTNLTVTYKPSKEAQEIAKGKILMKRLQVEEGSKTAISLRNLDFQMVFSHDLQFNVTSEPEHGFLQISTGSLTHNRTNYFTISEIRNEHLFYVHDDSETTLDSFKFMALSKEDDFEYAGTFYIDIGLKNDNSPVRVIDKLFHVVVGGERKLTGNDLRFFDKDSNTKTKDIKYSFKEFLNGHLFNIQNPDEKLLELTQEDLDKERIIFKHNGPEFSKLKFSVTDGLNYVTGVLEVQASAPFVRAVIGDRLIVQYGKSAVINRDHISYDTNLPSDDEDVTYEVTAKPTFGRIIYADTAKDVWEFSQAQVNRRLIAYKNEVTISGADEVKLKIKCRETTNVAQLRIWMLASTYWEPLHIKTLKQIIVEESTSAIISKSVVEIIQPEVPPSAIIYHLIKEPDHGYLSILSSSEDDENQSNNVKSFSQALINRNRVIYVQSVANTTNDQIGFNVSNGIVWLYELVIEIQIIPEHIYLGTHVLNVNEGGIATITPSNLYVQTEFYKSRVTDYDILEQPSYGRVLVHKRFSKHHGFSQKELNIGLVNYEHDGSENLQDSITLMASAGEKRSFSVMLKIKAVPINDQRPKLINNTGLIMWEGGTAIITNSFLAATDADRPKEILKYQVLSCLSGNISLLTDPTTSLQYFTQELIDRDLIVFRHQNGSDADFTFNISDGLHTTKEYKFIIKTKPVKLTLTYFALHIFPLQRKYITSNHLLAEVSDPDREICFEVIEGPTYGRLMMESEKTPGFFNIVNKFTQKQLNSSRVFYEHTHSFVGLYANDSFVFNVRAHLTKPLLNKVMLIDISVSSGGLDAFVNIPKINVDEGGMTNIVLNLSGVVSFLEQHASVRSPVIHASAETPRHGQIFLQNQLNQTTFTQQQLESGNIQYQHDHSDSLGDNLYFSLFLIPGYIMLCNVTVPIIINPINDQPFKLVTPAPHFDVVQGENYTITRNDLCTEDADTATSDLLYDIISGPQDGRVILLPDGLLINHFSQDDINNRRLLYIHNSSRLTDSFHLRVWDGKFRPEYTVLNINILPVSVNISQGLPLYIQQGMNVVLVTNKQFSVKTNANRNKIFYKMKTLPRHGVLFVKDNIADEFVQEDLDSHRVMYMQRDMTTANDSFIVFVSLFNGNSTIGEEVKVLVKVQPLMQIGNCTVLAGETYKLSLQVMDATPLAKLTNSNPKYTITCGPRYGKIRKIIRSSGGHHNILDKTVSNFTHEELQSGLIHLTVNDIEVQWGGTFDKICFTLAATIFQPAQGEIKVLIKSSSYNEVYSTLAGPFDPAGHEGGLHFASPNMTGDYFLIVSMVAGIVLLGIAVIVIIKCRAFEPEDLNKEDQCLQPIPLPRPPDRLLSVSPNLKHSDAYMSSLPTTLPHCRVTPLSRNDLDNNGRYPYGAEEHSADDWSSCDASDPTSASRNNVMLRRNQYWV